MIENWPMEMEVVEDDGGVAATAGGGIVCWTVVWTCGGGKSTCAAELDAKIDVDVDVEKEVKKVLVVLVWVLMSVLGNAVHLLPPSVVMKAPRGRFGLVAMSSRSSSCAVSRFQSQLRVESNAHCATGASPPVKGASEARFQAAWAIKLEPNSSRRDLEQSAARVALGGVVWRSTSCRGAQEKSQETPASVDKEAATMWFCWIERDGGRREGATSKRGQGVVSN